MKTCDEYQELISAYVDGETNERETSELFFHLGECGGCRAFMKSVLALQSTLREIELPAKTSSVGVRVPLWKRRFAIPYPVAATLALLLLFSGIFFFSRRAQPPAEIINTRTEYVYLTAFPPVYIVGSQTTEAKSN